MKIILKPNIKGYHEVYLFKENPPKKYKFFELDMNDEVFITNIADEMMDDKEYIIKETKDKIVYLSQILNTAINEDNLEFDF